MVNKMRHVWSAAILLAPTMALAAAGRVEPVHFGLRNSPSAMAVTVKPLLDLDLGTGHDWVGMDPDSLAPRAADIWTDQAGSDQYLHQLGELARAHPEEAIIAVGAEPGGAVFLTREKHGHAADTFLQVPPGGGQPRLFFMTQTQKQLLAGLLQSGDHEQAYSFLTSFMDGGGTHGGPSSPVVAQSGAGHDAQRPAYEGAAVQRTRMDAVYSVEGAAQAVESLMRHSPKATTIVISLNNPRAAKGAIFPDVTPWRRLDRAQLRETLARIFRNREVVVEGERRTFYEVMEYDGAAVAEMSSGN